MDDSIRRIQTLENQVAQQLRLVESLRAHGVLGFFQRLRLRKVWKNLPKIITEDQLRKENFNLKEKVRELQRGNS